MYAAAIGDWNSSDEECLLTGAAHASTKLHFTSLDIAAREMEERSQEARCIFVAPHADISALVSRLRERASLLTVPVIAVVPHPSDALYRSAFAYGADDALVSGDRGGITRRLANLLTCKPRETQTPTQGVALVASNDLGMRRMLGKTLRRAGFDVAYANEARELVELARAARSLSLVVATDDFPPLGADAAIRSARTAAGKPALPALIVPNDGSALFDSERADASDTASKLMCFAEDVMRRDGTELRASRRLPHANICAFRPAGIHIPIYGFSHNISREGMFVRTLDAPKPGSEVWIELCAPGSNAMVHLRGDVMWRREPGALGATPFGFGVKLAFDKCPPSDLAAYTTGYDTQAQAASHSH